MNTGLVKGSLEVSPLFNSVTTATGGGGGDNNVITTTFQDPEENDSAKEIIEVCHSVRDLLLEKNRKYGDSALNPARIFATSDSVEQIRVRIDDKLNRIKNAQADEDEDVIQDLIGYLVLLTIATNRSKKTATATYN
jgi:CRISPR/Cas system CSM-associated protein Csm2 small subunit